MSERTRAKKRSLIRFALALLLGTVTIMIFNSLTGLPDLTSRSSAHVIPNGADTGLGRQFQEALAANPGHNGFHELPLGRDAFAARVVLSRLAERSIDAQYYMWHQDTVGRSLVFELIAAADRGVRVRLLIDDMYGSDGEDTWRAMDAHPNIEVRLFAPYSRRQPKYLQFLTRFGDVNARMHTKTFTFDDQATIVGGRNIGDEYFEADPKLSFADNDVLTIGPAVEQVSRNFDDYWNGDYAYPVSILLPTATGDDLDQLKAQAPGFMDKKETQDYFSAVSQGRFAAALRDGSLEFKWGPGTVVHDAWWKRQQSRADWHDSLLITQLKPWLLGAREELILVSPYFVPGTESVQAFCGLAAQGVRIRVLTNSLASNDVVAVHAGYTKYREDLLRCGVELFELNEWINTKERKAFSWLPSLKKSSLHAKTMIIDREKMFVGSFNYDQRSLYLNTEIGMVFDQADIAGPAAKRFDDNIDKFAFRVQLAADDKGKDSITWTAVEDGKTTVFDQEPYVGPGTRAAVRMMRWLPIDWLL